MRAGVTEKQLLQKYDNVQNIPVNKLSDLVSERIEIIKPFVEFDHKVMDSGVH